MPKISAFINKIAMQDLLKKIVNTGVGFASTTTETFKTRYNDVYSEVEKRQQTSEKEGEKLVSTLQKNVESKYEEVRNGLKGRVNETVEGFAGQLNATMEKLNIPTTEVFEVVDKRMKSLERKINTLAKDIEARQN